MSTLNTDAYSAESCWPCFSMFALHNWSSNFSFVSQVQTSSCGAVVVSGSDLHSTGAPSHEVRTTVAMRSVIHENMHRYRPCWLVTGSPASVSPALRVNVAYAVDSHPVPSTNSAVTTGDMRSNWRMHKWLRRACSPMTSLNCFTCTDVRSCKQTRWQWADQWRNGWLARNVARTIACRCVRSHTACRHAPYEQYVTQVSVCRVKCRLVCAVLL
jgi:hypothetical protein